MSWSLGETAALALKAARGAGMSWGLAEETAASVVWLHGRGLPGMSALCSYLGSTDTPRTDGPACPIITGCALIDGTMEAPERLSDSCDLGLVQAPLLLLPFVARLDPGTLATPPASGAGPDGWRCWQVIARRCKLPHRISAGHRSTPPERLTRLGDSLPVASTGLAPSRTAPMPGDGTVTDVGAGASLTDND